MLQLRLGGSAPFLSLLADVSGVEVRPGVTLLPGSGLTLALALALALVRRGVAEQVLVDLLPRPPLIPLPVQQRFGPTP